MEDIVAVRDKWPVGFGFRPTDEELVGYYLRHKLFDNDDDRINIFPEIDLRTVEPWQVPGLPMIKSDDPQRFFFSLVNHKYSNSKRVDRTTTCGFWKSTGKDRDIKVSGTDDVIWKKKTLVYYEGRVPNGVKSNWVIHEYHAEAVTFPENQRGLVLCHLMYKAGKGGIDAKICDEGEPSTVGHIGSSDHENMATEGGVQPVGVLPEMNMETIFQSMHQEEIDFPSLQQSPNSIEQEALTADNAYFKNEEIVVQTPFETTEEGKEFSTSILPPIEQSPTGIEPKAFVTSFSAHNAHSKNEDCNMQTQFETIEEGDESLTFTEEQIKDYLKSIFPDEDFVLNEEGGHGFVNSSTQSESLKRIHYESNDTYGEATSTLGDNIVDTLAMCNEHPSSGEYHVSKRLKSIHGNKEESIIQNDFWRVETSSCDSTTDKPLEANCVEISSSRSTLRR